jgi:conjugative transfer pilus assembly protein TraH
LSSHASRPSVAGLIVIGPGVQVKAIEGDALIADGNFGQKGGIADVFGAWTNTSAQGDPIRQVKANAPQDLAQVIQGNLVWRALNRANAGGWFRFGGNDFLKAIMSVTGSVIVQPPASAADGQGENMPVVTVPPILRIRDLINGSGEGNYQGVQVYVCDDPAVDGGLHPTAKALDLVGPKQQVERLLVGTGGGDGWIAKFATNTGTLTDGEKAFMELVPDALGALIRNLAREDVGMARLFAEEGAPVIALELAQLLVQGMLEAVRQASALDDHAYARKLTENLDRAREDLRAEYSELSGRYGIPQTLLAFYQNLMASLKPGQYGSVTGTPGSEPAFPRP